MFTSVLVNKVQSTGGWRWGSFTLKQYNFLPQTSPQNEVPYRTLNHSSLWYKGLVRDLGLLHLYVGWNIWKLELQSALFTNKSWQCHFVRLYIPLLMCMIIYHTSMFTVVFPPFSITLKVNLPFQHHTTWHSALCKCIQSLIRQNCVGAIIFVVD